MDVRTAVRLLERIAPPERALRDDPIGLALGREDRPVRRVMFALEATPAVVEEALDRGIDLLVVHHHPLYRPTRTIRTDRADGRALARLLQADVAVYVMHTNADAADDGLNDVFAARVGLEAPDVLEVTGREALFKLAVFVPASHHEAVLQAIGDAGAGWIGNYSHCTFNTPGTGTFWAREGADPFLGKIGELTRADEIRLETIVPAGRLDAVLQAMLAVHPYEEVAYDLYPLANEGRPYGLGRIGRLRSPMTLAALAALVAERFGLEGVRIVGDPERPVTRAAVYSGSGARAIPMAAARGADVLITGDVGYHDAREAEALGLAVIDGGHHMEKWFAPHFAGRFRALLAEAEGGESGPPSRSGTPSGAGDRAGEGRSVRTDQETAAPESVAVVVAEADRDPFRFMVRSLAP
ncbi:Nif3-like dinuclear metal center hexameric protein [Hydrogenibacillus schlegelii]|uniref:GTP cyclohydrolase 1 type 2 homolog n=1 Tax=Hydrogenibacillus schlegelii TaxID=1484 RepID=A0A179IUH0_HYDSH|nr:Nif3-like dinuclear metal center hexameric protein [Hydrogenibacillus schlegelii]OAR05411.1 hypothetical protein SA87_10950 [Hydrogenibacillus schlegelii]